MPVVLSLPSQLGFRIHPSNYVLIVLVYRLMLQRIIGLPFYRIAVWDPAARIISRIYSVSTTPRTDHVEHEHPDKDCRCS